MLFLALARLLMLMEIMWKNTPNEFVQGIIQYWLWKEGLRMFYTSTAPYIFTVWCLIRHNLHFYFYFLVIHNLISFAVNDGHTPAPQYQGLRNAMATIFRQEGARGLYRGVTPNVWGSGSAWGFYFLLYVPSMKFFLLYVPSVTLP